MPLYQENFPAAAGIGIAKRSSLENFKQNRKYHHALEYTQLDYAALSAEVRGVALYHGGDPLHKLQDVPGTWRESCLEEGKKDSH